MESKDEEARPLKKYHTNLNEELDRGLNYQYGCSQKSFIYENGIFRVKMVKFITDSPISL